MVTDLQRKNIRVKEKKKNREKDKRYMDTQRLPKKEEEEADHLLSSTFESINGLSRDQHNHSIDDFDSIFDITIDNLSCSHELTWDFWEEDEDEDVGEEEKRLSTDQEGSSFGFWENKPTDYEDKDLGLKLNLNHQEVIDAWSDHRKPLWTDNTTVANSLYKGEVPVIEEERNMRREASVLRYKEKRQSRLFSKKIRVGS
ncbi:zinc finger protein CONSTANS-LIKE 8 isoform X1 [Arabidopsis lyrata subsp. lyrata]|uniref:zinc finger protein CONSTANS-LIKE 8 isoform X1 n=1 Tax=Arabidopsis lyrata subsp. lyrata TaxID=81972 RepID=UPI000A29E04D|nr:zinc finger protein CONSTANS-LIKE 8 isoform X1 [Arabidopsis lyrata subsp. lyrata]|eukprot:XP_020867296.1 zinc finger protein CONSTANS-LIKE 8 isoform X1 [Arabidopsis lyrata subsp. lyrata]